MTDEAGPMASYDATAGPSDASDATGPPALACLMAVVAVIVGVGVDLSPMQPHDDQRLIQVLVLTLTLVVLALDPRRRRAVTGLLVEAPRAWGAVGVVVAVGAVSSLLAADPWTGAIEVALLVAMALHAAAVATEVRARPEATTILLVGTAVAAALVLLPLLSARGTSNLQLGLWQRSGFGTGFSNPRFLNQLQAGALPLLALLAMRLRGDARRTLVALLIAATTWSMTLTEGRGATIALVVGLVVVGVPHGDAGRRYLRALGVPGAIGLAAALVTRRLLGLEGLLVTGDITSASGRVQMWQETSIVAAANPLLGVGPGHLAWFEGAIEHASHPHDLPLQLAAEWGLPATLVLAVLVMLAAPRILRPSAGHSRVGRSDADAADLRAGATAAVLTVGALSLVSGMAVMPMAQAVTVVGAGLMLATYGRPSAAPTTPGAAVRRTAGVLVATLALTAAAILVTEVAGDPVATQAAAQERYVEVSGDSSMRPRFWLQGRRGLP